MVENVWDGKDVKEDKRPPLGGWASGLYYCKCFPYGDTYIGDKRSVVCADCAYGVSLLEEACCDWFKIVKLQDAKYRCSTCLRPSTISGRHLGMSEIGLTKDILLWAEAPLVESDEHKECVGKHPKVID